MSQNKFLQALGIPFSALVSVIFGLMLFSFPIGTYVVFNSGIDKDINFDYPIQGYSFFPAGIGFEIPLQFELGDGFIVAWSIFLILFTIAMIGPRKNFLNSFSPLMTGGKYESGSNYLVEAIKWFSILIVVSGAISFVQESLGVFTQPPPAKNLLVQFFDVTVAPLGEELGFRAMLIGIPLFAFYAKTSSFRLFFRTLWSPKKTLGIEENYKAIILIASVAVFFGAAHVLSGEPWSFGKFAQATASGVILGWVYFRFGLLPAIMVHWATNYFIFSFVYLLADINEVSIQNAFLQPLIGTLEILLVSAGVLAIFIIILNYIGAKKETRLEI